MSQNSNTQPPKGILKKTPKKAELTISSTSRGTASKTQQPSRSTDPPQHAKFDEKNIKATFHPADKDYGFDVIKEAKTPFHPLPLADDDTIENGVRRSSADSESNPGVDASLLSIMLAERGKQPPKSTVASNQQSDFEAKRKAHYDEFKIVKSIDKTGDNEKGSK